MAYFKWRADAQEIAGLIPDQADIVTHVDYLLNDIAEKGVEVHSTNLMGLPVSRRGSFAVVDASDLHVNVRRIEMGTATAAVIHKLGTSALILSLHNPKTPLSSGMTLLHELEHVTEREEAIAEYTVGRTPEQYAEQTGKSERRAYSLNAKILHAVDGSDFDNYVSVLGYVISEGNIKSSKRLRLFGVPRPPKGTLMRDIWKEGNRGYSLIRNIGGVARLEQLAQESSVGADMLIGRSPLVHKQIA